MLSKIAGKLRRFSFTTNVLALFILSSCLSIEADINIRKNGKVEMNLEYQFDRKWADFGRGFGADEPWLLPLTEKDFMLQTVRNGDVRLKRYQSRRLSDGGEKILVELEAQSVKAAMDFLGWEMTKTVKNDSQTLALTLPPVALEAKESAIAFYKLALTDSVFNLRIKPPSSPNEVSGGRIEGSSGVFSISMEDLVFSNESQIWTVSW